MTLLAVTLIPFGPEHVEIARVWRNENRNAFFDTREITAEQQQAWYETTYRPREARGDERMFVVHYEGRPVGLIATIRHTASTVEIGRVLLGDKTRARRGIMLAALQHVMEGARREGATDFTLQVKPDNVRAIGLYEKSGFVEVDRTSDRSTFVYPAQEQTVAVARAFDDAMDRGGSDKGRSGGHCYGLPYARHVRSTPASLLEIGVSGCGSLRGWRSLFSTTRLYGIDIDPRCATYGADLDAQIYIGDVQDRAFTAAVTARLGRIDMVVDDGSHTPDAILGALDAFLPSTVHLYVIEDVWDAHVPIVEAAVARHAGCTLVVSSSRHARRRILFVQRRSA